MVGAKALYQGPHQSRAHVRFGDKRCRKQLADVAIDVADAVLRRNVSKVGGQRDAAGALEPRQRWLWIPADVAVGRVVDDEVELRPILGCLTDVGDISEAAQVRKLLLHPWREQALVNADVLDAR